MADIPLSLLDRRVVHGRYPLGFAVRQIAGQLANRDPAAQNPAVVGIGADTGGDVIGGFIAGSDDMLEAIRECERHGWVVASEGYVQLQSYHLLQSSVRNHLTRICTPFHPVYSEREIEHAFSRLSSFASKVLCRSSNAFGSSPRSRHGSMQRMFSVSR